MHFDASTDMAARGQHWDKFKAKMKDLCQAKKGKKDLGKSSKELDTIAVQHLSAEKSLAKPRSTLASEHASSCRSKISTNTP